MLKRLKELKEEREDLEQKRREISSKISNNIMIQNEISNLEYQAEQEYKLETCRAFGFSVLDPYRFEGTESHVRKKCGEKIYNLNSCRSFVSNLERSNLKKYENRLKELDEEIKEVEEKIEEEEIKKEEMRKKREKAKRERERLSQKERSDNLKNIIFEKNKDNLLVVKERIYRISLYLLSKLIYKNPSLVKKILKPYNIEKDKIEYKYYSGEEKEEFSGIEYNQIEWYFESILRNLCNYDIFEKNIQYRFDYCEEEVVLNKFYNLETYLNVIKLLENIDKDIIKENLYYEFGEYSINSDKTEEEYADLIYEVIQNLLIEFPSNIKEEVKNLVSIVLELNNALEEPIIVNIDKYSLTISDKTINRKINFLNDDSISFSTLQDIYKYLEEIAKGKNIKIDYSGIYVREPRQKN